MRPTHYQSQFFHTSIEHPLCEHGNGISKNNKINGYIYQKAHDFRWVCVRNVSCWWVQYEGMASAPVVETLPVVGYYDSSPSDTLVVNEDGSTEQLSIPAVELASPKSLKIRK